MESLTFQLGGDGVFHTDTLVKGILEGGSSMREGPGARTLWAAARLEGG